MSEKADTIYQLHQDWKTAMKKVSYWRKKAYAARAALAAAREAEQLQDATSIAKREES